MKKENGITLMALVITIIVLLIITGIGLGTTRNKRSSIKESQDAVAIADIKKVQQAAGEAYIKYINTKNISLLKGTKMIYSEVKDIETEFKKIDSSVALKQSEYDLSTGSPETFYYKLNAADLKQIGFSSSEEDTEYIVNYSTGEVFNNTLKETALGNVLYVHMK